MRKLFSEYTDFILAAICGISIITIFLGVYFSEGNPSLAYIVETWISHLV